MYTLKTANALLLLAFAGIAQAGDLNVEIQGATGNTGAIRVAIFNAADDFPKKPLTGHVAKVENGQARVQFTGLPPGRYALSAYHDLNDNGKLDRGAFGIPKEPYGFSLDARSNAGPPEFRDAAFTVGDAATTQRIQLR